MISVNPVIRPVLQSALVWCYIEQQPPETHKQKDHMNQQGLARQVMIKQACATHVNPICSFALLHFLTDIKRNCHRQRETGSTAFSQKQYTSETKSRLTPAAKH